MTLGVNGSPAKRIATAITSFDSYSCEFG